MIDKPARKKLSELLRHLVSGQITNDQFEDNSPFSSNDRAIWAIRHQAWGLYSDFGEYKLKGKKALSPKNKHAIATWLLFLKSNFEYEWPTHPGQTWWGALLSFLSLGLIPRIFWNKKWIFSGNFKIWPFIREKDSELCT
jgi:hypothetical protein